MIRLGEEASERVSHHVWRVVEEVVPGLGDDAHLGPGKRAHSLGHGDIRCVARTGEIQQRDWSSSQQRIEHGLAGRAEQAKRVREPLGRGAKPGVALEVAERTAGEDAKRVPPCKEATHVVPSCPERPGVGERLELGRALLVSPRPHRAGSRLRDAEVARERDHSTGGLCHGGGVPEREPRAHGVADEDHVVAEQAKRVREPSEADLAGAAMTRGIEQPERAPRAGLGRPQGAGEVEAVLGEAVQRHHGRPRTRSVEPKSGQLAEKE